MSPRLPTIQQSAKVNPEADSADEAADAAETTEVDEADVANYAIVADNVDGTAVLYSLTKYSAIFAEVKGFRNNRTRQSAWTKELVLPQPQK